MFRDHDCMYPNVPGDTDRDEIEIFILWDMDAESMVELPSIISIHQTLEAAQEAMDPVIRGDYAHFEREPYDPYIEHYTYQAISQHRVGR